MGRMMDSDYVQILHCMKIIVFFVYSKVYGSVDINLVYIVHEVKQIKIGFNPT